MDQNVSVGRAQCLPRLQPPASVRHRRAARAFCIPRTGGKCDLLERHAYWVDDGPEELLLFYCPDCAEREFSQTL